MDMPDVSSVDSALSDAAEALLLIMKKVKETHLSDTEMAVRSLLTDVLTCVHTPGDKPEHSPPFCGTQKLVEDLDELTKSVGVIYGGTFIEHALSVIRVRVWAHCRQGNTRALSDAYNNRERVNKQTIEALSHTLEEFEIYMQCAVRSIPLSPAFVATARAFLSIMLPEYAQRCAVICETNPELTMYDREEMDDIVQAMIDALLLGKKILTAFGQKDLENSLTSWVATLEGLRTQKDDSFLKKVFGALLNFLKKLLPSMRKDQK